MPLRDVFYAPVPDNDVFSKRQFGTPPWFLLSNNARHFVATRGRVLAKHHSIEGPPVQAGGLSERLRFVFDRTPEEDTFLCAAIFSVGAWFVGADSETVTWRVDTDDTTGLHGHTGEDTETIEIALPVQADQTLIRDYNVIPFSEHPGVLMEERRQLVRSQWIRSTPAAGAATTGTVAQVYASATGAAGVRLAGVVIVGVMAG